MASCPQLWLELSRIFLAQQQLDDARFCVRQARNGTPWSPAAHHMAGRVLQVSLPVQHGHVTLCKVSVTTHHMAEQVLQVSLPAGQALVQHSACWWVPPAGWQEGCYG